MLIRAITEKDAGGIWRVLEPTIRAGETYALPRDMSRADALAFWMSPGYYGFVAEENGEILGTYTLRANHQGGGSHVANCGYITLPSASGRGVARAMCAHSIDQAKSLGFRAIQFNFVVSSNDRAIRLWTSFGFQTVGRLPGAFLHPVLGFVDALVMYRVL